MFSLFKRYSNIKMKIKRLSSNLKSGGYKSFFHGEGIEFADLKSYDYGDDIRYLDWLGLARTGEANVKLFVQEKSLDIFLLCDTSASMSVGGKKKGEILTEIVEFFVTIAQFQQHSLGVGFFHSQLYQYFPMKSGKKHVLRILNYARNLDFSHKNTSLDDVIKDFLTRHRKRSLCFLISDFYDDNYQDSLRTLCWHHDVVLLCLRTKEDYQLPLLPFLRVNDVESGNKNLLSKKQILNFEREKNLFYQQQESFFKNQRIDYLLLEDSAKWLLDFTKFLQNRR